ncbi:MAG TPA: hypothetical protein VGA45_03430 [Actinomycetota bacterium]
MSAPSPDRPDKVEGRALSPRPFRHFGIEAVMLGPAVRQEGLLRREGVAVWRRLESQALVFDRVKAQVALRDGDLLAVRVVVATTPARDRALRVPAVGERAARVLSAASEPPPTGWLLLVDEGPGETWLYLAEEDEPAEVLAGFIGRRGRTDFARARRRSRLGGLGSAGIFAGLVLIFYSTAFGIGVAGQVAGAALAALSVVTLVRARPR